MGTAQWFLEHRRPPRGSQPVDEVGLHGHRSGSEPRRRHVLSRKRVLQQSAGSLDCVRPRLQPLTTGATTMSRMMKTVAVAALAVAVNGCSDFLSGDKLDSDPNRPTTAQASQLFIASQVNSYYILNGHAARVLAMWMQQMAGTDRQYRGYDQY